MKAANPSSIDEYISAFPPDVRAILEKLRATIKKAAPAAEEKISYQIPTFTLKGNLVHFGAFKTHIGFYPPVRDAKLKAEASTYAGEKGNLRFPLDKPIPYALVTKLVKARVRENQEKTDAKSRRR
ncbi:MAG: iron chaperone [Gemmatimonadota bacterium]